MSYSETVTKEDLKNVLNEVLPQSRYIQSLEYVGDYGSNVFNNSWTATDDGVAIVKAGWSTGGAFAYWYVNDQTDGRQVANLGGTANGTTLTTMIPIIKGHTYRTTTAAAVTSADFYFYKFTLKETTPESAVDYIVDQGTSGIWTYRKWNSGIAECWGRISISGLTTTTNLPFTFANTSYETQVTLINNSNSATNVTAITSNAGSVSIGVNIVPSGGARLYIIGRWK